MSADKWRPLHEDAKYNEGGRRLKKLVAKSAWSKKRKMEEDGYGVEDPVHKKSRVDMRTKSVDGVDPSNSYSDRDKTPPSWVGSCSGSQYKEKDKYSHENSQDVAAENKIKIRKKKMTKSDPPTIAVMFVEQTVGGMLAKRLQEVEDRLAGYRVRISAMS